MHRIARHAGLELWASADLFSWKAGSSGGWYWLPLTPNVKPSAWTDVERYAMAPGVTYDEKGHRLHNDALGVHQLHYYDDGSSIYFSNWIPLLTRISKNVSVDVEAWVSVLLLGFVPPGKSQFQSLRSLPSFTSLRVTGSDTVLERTDPNMLAPRDPTTRPVLDSIGAGLPQLSPGALYTLSGGWDSRLLAGLAIRRGAGQTVETWTTETDGVDGRELHIASSVAAYLGTHHREILPSGSDKSRAMSRTVKRFNHQTWMHSWMEPLASQTRSARRPVVDGLGGDVLLKGLYQTTDDDTKGSTSKARRALWERLGGSYANRDEVWSSDAIRLFEEVAFATFDDTVSWFSDSPIWQTLAVLTTRTARGISLAPLRLIGPEAEVYLPFLTHEALVAALQEPVHTNRGHDFYRSLFSSFDQALGKLPSTNDNDPPTPPRRRRSTDHPALGFIESMLHQPTVAHELLAPRLAETLINNDRQNLNRLLSWSGPSRAILGACTYAAWLSDNPRVQESIL